jgi:hypothetical protein
MSIDLFYHLSLMGPGIGWTRLPRTRVGCSPGGLHPAAGMDRKGRKLVRQADRPQVFLLPPTSTTGASPTAQRASCWNCVGGYLRSGAWAATLCHGLEAARGESQPPGSIGVTTLYTARCRRR